MTRTKQMDMDNIIHERTASNSGGHSVAIPLRVLILEDDPRDVELCIQELKKAGFELQADAVDTEENFVSKLQSCDYHLILSDFRMPTWSGVEAFRVLKLSGKDIPFILVTGTLGEEAAVDLIKEGVADYILKDRLVRLPSAVRRALQEQTTRDERERAIQSLRESEERVRLLLDSTAEAIYGIDGQGNCTFCNSASIRLLGYESPKDLLGKQMHRLMHHTRPDGAPYPVEECQIYMAFREGKGSHADDEVLWRRDGSSFPAEYWSYPVVRGGKPIGSVVTFLDITDRKRTDEHMRSLVQAIESSSELIAMADSIGTFVFVNDAFKCVLGYLKEELVGEHLRVVMSPNNSAAFFEEFGKKMYEPGGWAGECLLVRRNHSDLLVYLTVGPVINEEGRVVGSFGVAQDITDQKRTQENVRRLAEIVQSSDDAIIRKTPEGTIVSWNGGAERMYGYSAEEAIGKPISFLCAPEQRDEIPAILEKIRRNERVEHLECVRARKDGKKIRISLTVSPIRDVSGEIVGASAIARDITESKQMEDMFRQAQKMEAVGRLAGGIAHDFNNLLGVIIGYSEIFEERLGKNDPLKPKAEQIKKAGQRAAALTRQLLAFSRQQVIEPTVLNLNAVVADTLKMLNRLIGEDIDLVAILEPELGLVKSDQGQIGQVIMNLSVNARDAMPQGGKLTIATANVELDEVYVRLHPPALPGSYVMLAVSDTGCGMDRETQTHIFDPFFTTKEQGKGTGLGLSTVYGIVKQSGGAIWVYSELGLGTTFKIYLPRVTEGVRLLEQGNRRNDIARGWETILLVEDSQALRELARELLEDSGYTVLEAAGGADAIRMADQYQLPIHLLITDVVMPEMDGRTLGERMILTYPGIKVLYMSGYTDDAIMSHGVLGTKISLLQKPFSIISLTSKVREVLGMAS